MSADITGPSTGHHPPLADERTLQEAVDTLRQELSAVDHALGDRIDQVLWPHGLTRAEAIDRLIRAVRLADLMMED